MSVPAISEPAATQTDATPAARITQCMAEMHMLAKLPRTGWLLAGVQSPESIAVHCYETALIAYLLSEQASEPVDISKVLLMSLFHETGEVRVSNQPPRARPYLGPAKDHAETQVIKDVLREVGKPVVALLEERDAGQTIEARISIAAEELQGVFVAMMYAKEHNGDLSEFRADAERFHGQGIALARSVAEILASRLGEYLGEQRYWAIGYDNDHTA